MEMTGEMWGFLTSAFVAAHLICDLGMKVIKHQLPTKSLLTPKEGGQLADIHEWGEATDPEGRRLMYTPASFSDNQKEVARCLVEVVHTLKEISEALMRSQRENSQQHRDIIAEIKEKG